MPNIQIILIAHNLRSCHNVGSLLRTADGLGVSKVVLSGYTPYPLKTTDDPRLPHLAQKIHKQIQKTALGAETSQVWETCSDLSALLKKLKADNWMICALEQADGSTPLPDFVPPAQLVLLIGREAEGIEPEVLASCDAVIEIPMRGQKESYNVVQAAAMALYHCTFI